MQNKQKKLMIILSSPSGAGKTSICKELLKIDKKLRMSISATTRPKRPSEINKVDYFFYTEKDFKKYLRNKKFLEYAHIFGNYYGTPTEFVENTLKEGFDVIFDIDWQGTQQLVKKVKKELISFFILPPNTKELRKRLEKRNEDSLVTVENRMSKARSEISHWNEYDYVIINDNLKRCVKEILQIINVERKKRQRLTEIKSFVDFLIRK